MNFTAKTVLFCFFIFSIGLISFPSHGIKLPAGFTQVKVASGLEKAMKMRFAPDGRIFIIEREGNVRIVKDGNLLPTPFLQLNVELRGERGLLGIEVDPDFARSPYIYLFYTTREPRNRISRFRADKDQVSAASEEVLLEFAELAAGIHNSGALRFGTDGLLYATTGDNRKKENAQLLNNLQGKVLRIRKDGSIPASNPFFDETTGVNRAIWARGFRNPFTLDVQATTGTIFINDVGEDTWEEINRGVAGGNYGWPLVEGPSDSSEFENPVYAYNHSSGGCAITGSAFYNPPVQQFPAAYRDRYFFGDYCADTLWTRDSTGKVRVFASEIPAPLDLAVDREGALHYIPMGSGLIYKIIYTGDLSPVITDEPEDRITGLGQSVTFTCGATGLAPLSFQWKKNGVFIDGAASRNLTVGPVSLEQNGNKYQCVVRNSKGSASSRSALLTVLNNFAPRATILTPSSKLRFEPGDRISFSGSGNDSEDGDLPASKMTWVVNFHHENHVHPHMPAQSGIKSGSFLVPLDGEPSRDTFYRVILSVEDSVGLKHETFVDILPAALQVPATLQAEHARIHSTGQAFSGDPNGWALFNNGFIEDRFRFKTTQDHLFQIRGRGTQVSGQGPRIQIKVDGAVVGFVDFNQPVFEVKTVKVRMTEGIHRIRFEYINDASTSTSDRNIYFDWFRVIQATTALSQGPSSN